MSLAAITQLCNTYEQSRTSRNSKTPVFANANSSLKTNDVVQRRGKTKSAYFGHTIQIWCSSSLFLPFPVFTFIFIFVFVFCIPYSLYMFLPTIYTFFLSLSLSFLFYFPSFLPFFVSNLSFPYFVSVNFILPFLLNVWSTLLHWSKVLRTFKHSNFTTKIFRSVSKNGDSH